MLKQSGSFEDYSCFLCEFCSEGHEISRGWYETLVTSGKAVLRTENKRYVYEGKGDQENESDSKCQIRSVAKTTMEIATN